MEAIEERNLTVDKSDFSNYNKPAIIESEQT